MRKHKPRKPLWYRVQTWCVIISFGGAILAMAIALITA